MRSSAGKTGLPGLVTLMLGHCSGILFLIALPVWVGTLITHFGYDARAAGALATAFLIAAALASLVCAPRLHRLPLRAVATGGFALAALVMLLAPFASPVPALPVPFALQAPFAPPASSALMLGLALAVAGACVGAALSVTHGAIGLSDDPHRVYALAGAAIGVGAIVFLGGAPTLVGRFGGAALFRAYALVTGTSAVCALLWFPAVRVRRPEKAPSGQAERVRPSFRPSFSAAVRLAIGAVVLMGMTQAMTLSQYERIGLAHGFSLARISLALALLGAATLLPAPAAGLLQKRVAATTIICTMPVLQALCALVLTVGATTYPFYLASGPLMEFNIMFTHTFAFGLLARLDPTGRAVAGTPAMLMFGAAVGPVLGGVLSANHGFSMVGYAAVLMVALQVLLFNRVRQDVLASRHRPARD